MTDEVAISTSNTSFQPGFLDIAGLGENRGWTTNLLITVVIMLATVIASPSATFTTIVNFNGTNGSGPLMTSLVQGKDGNLYGTTTYGGPGGADGYGTVFIMTPAGVLTTIYSFGNTPDGANPEAGLILGTDGNFYGTTSEGGANGLGTVFKITPAGKLTILHSFNGEDGEIPVAGLVEGTDGTFYGTTESGGPDSSPYGTIFKITPKGKLTTLHDFDGTDGWQPEAALVEGTDRKFFGTTATGGTSGFGTVFKITSAGAFTPSQLRQY
jgi:uncharacterized repeat protein (TIGR03803 family)